MPHTDFSWSDASGPGVCLHDDFDIVEGDTLTGQCPDCGLVQSAPVFDAVAEQCGAMVPHKAHSSVSSARPGIVVDCPGNFPLENS